MSMEFLCSFLRHHFAGKPVVVSCNVGCFLKLWPTIQESCICDTGWWDMAKVVTACHPLRSDSAGWFTLFKSLTVWQFSWFLSPFTNYIERPEYKFLIFRHLRLVGSNWYENETCDGKKRYKKHARKYWYLLRIVHTYIYFIYARNLQSSCRANVFEKIS